MKINTYLFKNEVLHQKSENIGSYDKEKQQLEFRHDDTNVIVNFDESFVKYKRENKEYDFEIYIDAKKSIASIKLKEHPNVFEIKVLYAKFELKKHMIIINYKIETEENVLNKIVIEWKELI